MYKNEERFYNDLKAPSLSSNSLQLQAAKAMGTDRKEWAWAPTADLGLLSSLSGNSHIKNTPVQPPTKISMHPTLCH